MDPTFTKVSWRELTVAVGVLGLVLVQESLLLHHPNALLFVPYLSMLGSEHWHFVRAELHVLLRMGIVTDNWFHRLLIVFASVVAFMLLFIDFVVFGWMVTLHVDDTRALT